MKRFLLLFVLTAAVAVATYALTRLLLVPGPEDPMAWLSRDFKLTARQAAAVEKLQTAYEPVCAEHCRLIAEARLHLAARPDDPAARAEIVRLEQKCTEATLDHLHAVAALMAPAQGQRFLTLVEPKVSRHDHEGPFGLQ